MRVSFDYGDTISRHPEQFRRWAEAIIGAGGEVFMLTGVQFDENRVPKVLESRPRKAWIETVNGPITLLYARTDHAAPDAHGPTKADLAVIHRIDLHVDNCVKVLDQITRETNGATMTLFVSGKPDCLFA